MKTILTATKADIKLARRFLAPKSEPRDYLRYAHCSDNMLYFADGYGMLIMKAAKLPDGYYNIDANGKALPANHPIAYPKMVVEFIDDIELGANRPLVVKEGKTFQIGGETKHTKTMVIDGQTIREPLWLKIKNLNPVLRGKVKRVAPQHISGVCDLGYFILMGIRQGEEK